MRKKYLSALLFGALLVTSAGTFTSCKDYDDEINDLQTQITDLQTSVKSLEELVKAGKYVTAVEKTAEGIKFTFNQGDPVIIALEEASQEGQVFELKDGEIYVDGEPTGIKPAKDPEKAPVKVENGVWVFLNESGEYESTNIPVTGVNVSGSKEEGYVLEIVNANGETQKIEVPTANSLVTSITFATIPTTNNLYSEAAFVAGDGTNKFYTVDGTEYAANSFISALNMDGTKGVKLNVVVTPSNVDPSDLKFSLVNSEGKTIFNDAVVSTPSSAIQAGSRAVEGVYELAFTIKEGVKTTDIEGDKIIADGDGLAVVCGKATTNFVYKFDEGEGITTTPNITLSESYVKLGEEYSIFSKGYKADPTTSPNAEKQSFISALNSVSSLKLDVEKNVAELYGITFNEDHTAFTIANESALGKTIKFKVYYTGYNTKDKNNITSKDLTVTVAEAAIVTEMSSNATHVLSTDADKTIAYFPLENIKSALTTPADKYLWETGSIPSSAAFTVVTNNTDAEDNGFALTSAKGYPTSKLTISNDTDGGLGEWKLYKADKTAIDEASGAYALKDAAYIGFVVNAANANVTADTYSALIKVKVNGKDISNAGTTNEDVITSKEFAVNFSLTLSNPENQYTRIPLYFDGDNLSAYGEVKGTNLEFNVTSAYNNGNVAPSFTVVNKETTGAWTVDDDNKTIKIPLTDLYTKTQKFEVSYYMFANAKHNKVTETIYVKGQSPIKDGEVTVNKTELTLKDGSDSFGSADFTSVDAFNKSFNVLASYTKEVVDASGTVTQFAKVESDSRIESVELTCTDANAGAFNIEYTYVAVTEGGKLLFENEPQTYNSLANIKVSLKENATIQNGAKVPFKITIVDTWGQKIEKEVTLTITK